MKSLQYFSRSLASMPMAAAAVMFAVLSAPLSAQSLQEQFEQANTELEALTLTNAQLRNRIALQEQLIEEMAESIEYAAMISNEETSPLNDLIERMMSSMEAFVESDLPFDLEERREEVARIRGLVDNPEAPLAQKLNLLIALYQAEGGYGRTLDTYETTLEVDGVEQEVTMTRIGRLMLAYQTEDRTTTAVWDKTSASWVELPAGDYRSAITTATNVASSLTAPELLDIPVPAPVAAQ
ncbi:MAG: DUF3450 domain-containing protein [Pseudohongiella sp.]|uniref:DUF3450 domain-containing protein n=1 Tax=Pseudohongiella sp. TaxID=1979412 RepID=UPI0034A04774